jgi:hypothetical protein
MLTYCGMMIGKCIIHLKDLAEKYKKCLNKHFSVEPCLGFVKGE